MKSLIKEIQTLNSNDKSIPALRTACENDDNIFPVEHERDDNEDNGFTQYGYIGTNIKVEHEKLVGFEFCTNGEWKLALFKDIEIIS